MLRRRDFLKGLAAGSWFLGASCAGANRSGAERRLSAGRFFFTSAGKTAMMDADSAGLSYLEFSIPDQATWQPGPAFADGRRVILLSMEKRRDGPGKPFDQYYHQTPTHLWIYDLVAGQLTEIATRDRLAPFYAPMLLLDDERLLVQVILPDRATRIFSMNLDGGDKREFSREVEGFPYGMSLSPDQKRVAFHTAGPSPHGYRIWTSGIDGGRRTLVAGREGHLYFGTEWSPDGEWILYQDCLFESDPGHDWSDICIGRPDGSEHRVLTSGQSQWFGATYGNPENRGGGSNMPRWTREGRILFSRRLPDSKVAWEFQPQRPDTDHFNRDFKPELARGGAQICRLDPRLKAVEAIRPLTGAEPPVWDFRPTPSPDSRHILFCRAETGGVPALWIMGSDGSAPRFLTRGLNGRGADHPRWIQ